MAYLYFMIKDHPFVDGNKRTACVAFEVFCDLNNLSPKYRGFELDELAVFIEKIRETDSQKVIKTIAMDLFT